MPLNFLLKKKKYKNKIKLNIHIRNTDLSSISGNN